MQASKALHIEPRGEAWHWPLLALMSGCVAVALCFVPLYSFYLVQFLPHWLPFNAPFLMHVLSPPLSAQPLFALCAAALTGAAIVGGAWRYEKAIRLFIAVFLACELLFVVEAICLTLFDVPSTYWRNLRPRDYFFIARLPSVLAIAGVNLFAVASGFAWTKWTVLLHIWAVIAVTILFTVPEPNLPEFEQMMHYEAAQANAASSAEVYPTLHIERVKIYPNSFAWMMYAAFLAYFFLLRERWKRAAASD